MTTGKRYKAKRRKELRDKSIAGQRTKATLCNIWINMGFSNPWRLRATEIAKNVAGVLSLELLDPQAIIAWAKENRPDLLRTARARHSSRKAAAMQPKPNCAEERAAFYDTWAWRTLRMEALKIHGTYCQCCGAGPGMMTTGGDPVRIVVDHIKPVSRYWHLRLKLDNLQILCEECNMGKGNWDETDFRTGPNSKLECN